MSLDLIVTKHLTQAAVVATEALKQKRDNLEEAKVLLQENQALHSYLPENTQGRRVKVLSISRAAQWYLVYRVNKVLSLVIEDKKMVKAIMADIAFALSGQTSSAGSHLSVAKKEFSDITFE